MSNSSIWPIDKTLSGATTLGQSGAGSDVNEGIRLILKGSSITGKNTAKMQSVYSTAPGKCSTLF